MIGEVGQVLDIKTQKQVLWGHFTLEVGITKIAVFMVLPWSALINLITFYSKIIQLDEILKSGKIWQQTGHSHYRSLSPNKLDLSWRPDCDKN